MQQESSTFGEDYISSNISLHCWCGLAQLCPTITKLVAVRDYPRCQCDLRLIAQVRPKSERVELTGYQAIFIRFMAYKDFFPCNIWERLQGLVRFMAHKKISRCNARAYFRVIYSAVMQIYGLLLMFLPLYSCPDCLMHKAGTQPHLPGWHFGYPSSFW